MTTKITFQGNFLDIYPYMNWIFLINEDGDVLASRTEHLIDDQELHDFLFRQSFEKKQITPPSEIIINTATFKKVASAPNKFNFTDFKIFYSNLVFGANDGLFFSTFETNTEKTTKHHKITDVPISSIAAKFMTIFAASMESDTTTLMGVKTGEYDKKNEMGPAASRIGISNEQIHYYFGSKDIYSANFEKSKKSDNNRSSTENEFEYIDKIGTAIENTTKPENANELPDYIFNSRDGIYFQIGNHLHYLKLSSKQWFKFPINIQSKIIKAHPIIGATCIESLDGLHLLKKDQVQTLINEECITSRTYTNSTNYCKTISASCDGSSFLFII